MKVEIWKKIAALRPQITEIEDVVKAEYDKDGTIVIWYYDNRGFVKTQTHKPEKDKIIIFK